MLQGPASGLGVECCLLEGLSHGNAGLVFLKELALDVDRQQAVKFCIPFRKSQICLLVGDGKCHTNMDILILTEFTCHAWLYGMNGTLPKCCLCMPKKKELLSFGCLLNP